jgi:UDP-glucose 4-epimerase
MRIFVTGAGGFVGAAVAREASRLGHEVLGSVRSAGRDHRLAGFKSALTVIELDLRNSEKLKSALQEFRPDVIVHSAWDGVSNKTHGDPLQITSNIETSCNLVTFGAQHGCAKFVGIGSQGEYGSFSRKINESDLPRPTSLYGASKLAVHVLTRQLAEQAQMAYAWVRIFSTFGPGDNQHWLIPSLIEQMLDGKRPQTTQGTQYFDCLFIDDIAKAVVSVVRTVDANGVFNLGSGQPVQIRTLVEKIRDLAAPDLELVFGEIPYGPRQIWHMEANISLLTAATGWTPTTGIDAGLAATVDWHRAQRLR